LLLLKKSYEFAFFLKQTKRAAWLPLLIVQGHQLALTSAVKPVADLAAAFSSKVFKIAKNNQKC